MAKPKTENHFTNARLQQPVYELDLARITPDPAQPRHLLPFDLRTAIQDESLSPADAIHELVIRAEQGETMALLILGGQAKKPADNDDVMVEDKGLLALARSIQAVGLRQPINVYEVTDPAQPEHVAYRLGEGERRFWAHHLLVQQGHNAFQRIKGIVEPLPTNEELIHRRQEAENAARMDLPAMARARSIQRIKERLNIEMGTRVPGQNTIKLPSQRELQTAIGQHVKQFTGRAISDRMVRNYLALLRLSSEAQDLAEAGQLTEKQLRPVMRLSTDVEQVALIRQIIEKKWSGRRVQQEISAPTAPTSALQEVSLTTVEERFEKRLLDAAKVVHALLSLPEEEYEQAITSLALKAKNRRTRQALLVLHQTLAEVLEKAAEQ